MKVELDFDPEIMASIISEKILKEIRSIASDKSANDVIFNVEALSKYLNVSKQWIYERIQFKQIPYIKMGCLLRFRR